MVDDGEAMAAPEFGIGDVTASTQVALVPSPLPQPADIGMPAAINAVNAAVPSGRTTIGDIIGSFSNAYLGAPPAPLGQTPASAPIVPPVGLDVPSQPLDLMTSGSVDVAAIPETAQAMPPSLGASQGWIIQIGAAPSENGATFLLNDAAGKVSSLATHQSFIQQIQKDGQTFFRARFGGFADQGTANDMCKQLKLAKMSCLAMQS
jgi:D-alanyl-D-alanine carboxypeptidase